MLDVRDSIWIFVPRNYFEPFVYYFIFWFSRRADWWTGRGWGWERRPFPFFSHWPWLLSSLFFVSSSSFVSFSPPGLMKGNLFSLSLTRVVYLAFLLRKSLGFLRPSLLAYMRYLQFFFHCLITGVNYRGNNICIMLISMQRLSIFLTFWHYLLFRIYILR